MYEAQQDLQFVEEEHRQLLDDVKTLEKMTLKEKEAVRQEKIKLAKRLEETERIGKDLEQQCERQSSTKAKVEIVYQQALDEYDRLHDVVKKVKAKEKECDSRPDLDKTLQAESYQWAEDEHKLRSQLHALQSQLKDVRAKHQDEIAAAEAKLRDAEARLHSDRMGREFPPANGRRPSGVRPSGSRAGSTRGHSTSLGRGMFTDDSLVMNSSTVAGGGPVIQPILVNKSLSRKRDHLGDLTNLS